MLRDVKRLPFLSSPQNTDAAVDALGERSPALLIDSQCVIVTGIPC